MIYFTAHTLNCVCHCIRAMFRVLGMYNFAFSLKFFSISRTICSHSTSLVANANLRSYGVQMYYFANNFVFWVKMYSELTWKFRIKIWIPILFNISVLLDVQANVPEKKSHFCLPKIALFKCL